MYCNSNKTFQNEVFLFFVEIYNYYKILISKYSVIYKNKVHIKYSFIVIPYLNTLSSHTVIKCIAF